MKFHHKIKPHHHLSIQAVSILILVLSFVFYYNASGQTFAEPSTSTKQFFGENESEGRREFNPPECQQEGSGESSGYQEGQRPPQVDPAVMQALGNELAQLKSESDAILAEMQTATEERKAQLQTRIAEIQKRDAEIRAQMSQYQQQSGQQGSPAQEQRPPENSGPSTACKTALVAMLKTHMTTFKNKINNNILPTFTKVDSTVAKLEAKIPALKASGFDAAQIAKLEAAIAKIKTNEVTIKGFFQEMLVTINQFLNLSSTSIDQAFTVMSKGFGKGEKHNTAGTAADSLVAAFREIEQVVNNLQ